MFLSQNFICISHFLCVRCFLHLHHPNCVYWKVQIMKQFPITNCHFLLDPNILPSTLFSDTLCLCLPPSHEWPSVTPIQNELKCSFVCFSFYVSEVSKLKVKFALTTLWRQGQRYSFAHSQLKWRGELLTSHFDCFTLRERAPDTHWIRGWMGPRAILDILEKRKNFMHLPGIQPGCIQRIPSRYAGWVCPYFLTFFLTYLLTYILHGAESFLKS